MTEIEKLMLKQEETDNRFQRHLTDYAKDNDSIKDEIIELRKEIKTLITDIQPVVSIFTGSKFTGNLLVLALKFLALLAAGIASVVYLAHLTSTKN